MPLPLAFRMTASLLAITKPGVRRVPLPAYPTRTFSIPKLFVHLPSLVLRSTGKPTEQAGRQQKEAGRKKWNPEWKKNGEVGQLIGGGWVNLLSAVTDLDMRPVIKATQGQNTDAVTVRKLGEQLKTFATVLATCRGRNISATAASVQQSLKRLEDANTLKPLQPLLRKIEPALASFRGEEIADGLAAARWCLDHQLYQQGYTILLETMITFVVNKALEKNGRDQQDRDMVNQCVTIIRDNIPEPKWLPPAGTDKTITRHVIAWLQPQQDLLNGLRNLADVRNDLNHAGHNDKACTPKTIQNKLVGHIEDMERIFARNIASADC